MELARRICQSLTEIHVREHYSTVVHSLYSLHMGNIVFGCKARSLLEGERHYELMSCLMCHSTALFIHRKAASAQPIGFQFHETPDFLKDTHYLKG